MNWIENTYKPEPDEEVLIWSIYSSKALVYWNGAYWMDDDGNYVNMDAEITHWAYVVGPES